MSGDLKLVATGLTLAELRGRSFVKMLDARRAAS